jgi:hypothetical protein
MDEEQRRLQRSRQICKNRCCRFLNGQSVSMVQYALSRKGQTRELSALETQIPCLNLPETISRIESTGIYMGVPVGRIPTDPLNFPVYIFDGKTHQFVRDASLKEYEKWGAAVLDGRSRATHR